MNKNNIEIEFKVNIKEPRKLEKWLKFNAKFIRDSHQIDYYFQPPHKDFIDKKSNDAQEWLRVRSSEAGNDITYKLWHHDENDRSTHCDEYEVEINNVESMVKILKVLGYRDLITIDKHRSIWDYEDMELAVDKVKGLDGLFIEIEYKGDSDRKPDVILKDMVEKLKTLEIGKWKKTKRGYIYMILNPDKEHYENDD